MANWGMPVDPIERASAVAADYEELHGLITLGIGVGSIAMALAGNPALGAVFFGLAAALGQGYYYKKYGKVRQSVGKTWAGIGAAVLTVGMVCAGMLVDMALRAPVLFGTLIGAVALVILGRVNYRHVGVTRIHLAVTGVLAVSALLPLTGLPSPEVFWRVDLGLIGLALIVIGAVDHYRLTNAMRSAADD